MSGVDVDVFGVKNRVELKECLEAEVAGQLDQRTIDEIDQAVRQNGPQQLENSAYQGLYD